MWDKDPSMSMGLDSSFI
jgi:hypothetical protein